MELPKGLVEGLKISRESSLVSQIDQDRKIKVANLIESDDIEGYLTTFECLM